MCQEQGGEKDNFIAKLHNINTNDIKQLQASATLPCCTVTFPQLEVDALIDTGASSNYIQDWLANKLNIERHQLTAPIIAKGAWSEDVPITEFCLLKFTIGTEHCKIAALIIPQTLTKKLILGMPFINKNPKVLYDTLDVKKRKEEQPIELVSWRNMKKNLKKIGSQAYLC